VLLKRTLPGGKESKVTEEFMFKIDNYVAVDIETTGLKPKTDRIIEIGAVLVRDGVIVDKKDWLINPKCAISEFVTGLTGIDDKMLENAPTIEEVMPEFISFCSEDVLLGHHIITDFSFLKRNAVNNGLVFEKKAIDTLKLARIILSGMEKKSLEYLRKELNLGANRSHRALDDALATVELYNYMATLAEANAEWQALFAPHELRYVVKKESLATPVQKKNLRKILEYHNLKLAVDIDTLTKNEASRYIDTIISEHGRMPKV